MYKCNWHATKQLLKCVLTVDDVHVKEEGKICQSYCRNTCMSFYAKIFILDESLVCSCEFQAKFSHMKSAYEMILWFLSKIFLVKWMN